MAAATRSAICIPCRPPRASPATRISAVRAASRTVVLRVFISAVPFPFLRSSALADLDLDLLGFTFLALGQDDLQNAIAVLGVDLLGVHRPRQTEGAAEGPVLALHAVVV